MKSAVLLLAFAWLMVASHFVIGGVLLLKGRPALHQQLAGLLTHPGQLGKDLSGIIVLQFQVSDDSRICRVRVFSGNAAIDAHFIRQLTGRKIRLPHPEFGQIHTIRIHLKSNQ